MTGSRLNRACGVALLVLAGIALLTVLVGFLQPPQPQPADEGTGAHIFQLSVVLFVAALALFLATADRREARGAARALALPGVLLVAAFVALYLLEHVR